MKYLVAGFVTVLMSASAALADTTGTFQGYAYGGAKNKAEWAKVDASCPNAGIGSGKLGLVLKSSIGMGAMELKIDLAPIKGFEEMTVYFRQDKDKKDTLNAAFVFDAGGGSEMRPLIPFANCDVVNEGGYSKVTIPKSQLRGDEKYPLKMVLISYDSGEAKDVKGVTLGAVRIKGDKGTVVPDKIVTAIIPAPASLLPSKP